MSKQRKKKAKSDKINCSQDEILTKNKHKMLVSKEMFVESFNLVKDEYFELEKVDLIDYQKFFDC